MLTEIQIFSLKKMQLKKCPSFYLNLNVLIWYHRQQPTKNIEFWVSLTHKRHPISHPYKQAMGHDPLCALYRKIDSYYEQYWLFPVLWAPWYSLLFNLLPEASSSLLPMVRSVTSNRWFPNKDVINSLCRHSTSHCLTSSKSLSGIGY